jgi:hypothetical protein
VIPESYIRMIRLLLSYIHVTDDTKTYTKYLHKYNSSGDDGSNYWRYPEVDIIAYYAPITNILRGYQQCTTRLKYQLLKIRQRRLMTRSILDNFMPQDIVKLILNYL